MYLDTKTTCTSIYNLFLRDKKNPSFRILFFCDLENHKTHILANDFSFPKVYRQVTGKFCCFFLILRLICEINHNCIHFILSVKFCRIIISVYFFVANTLFTSADTEYITASDSAVIQKQSVIREKNDICHFGYGGSAGIYYHFNREVDGANLVKSYMGSFYSLSMNYRALEQDSSVYDMAYGLPTINFGVMFGYLSHIKMHGNMPEADYNSHLGNQYTAYLAMHRDFLRRGRWSMGFSMENGISLTTKHYNKHNNVHNRFIGSNFSIYFGAGIYAKYIINPHFDIAMGLNFKHFSNSAMDRPNLGSNMMGIQAYVNYFPSPILTQPRKLAYTLPKVKPDFYLDLSVGWEGKTLQEEWNYNETLPPSDPNYFTGHYRVRTLWNTSLAAMFRYNVKYASGLALDYSYATYSNIINRIQKNEGIIGHSSYRHVLGVSLRHEVFYKQMSLTMNLGMYPYRHMGTLNKHLIYETVGLRWYPKSWHNFYISYMVKAHGMRADGLQLNLGYRILRRNKLF